MSVLGWQEGEVLDGVPSANKMLDWWLRKRTVAGTTRVTWAVDRVQRTAEGEVARWRTHANQ